MIYYCCDCGDELPTDWVLGHFEEDEVVQGVVPCRKCYAERGMMNKETCPITTSYCSLAFNCSILKKIAREV